MSIEVIDSVIYVMGPARLEDAETMAGLLVAGTGVVDLSGATILHTAVVQALLALRPELRGRPGDAFAATWLMPLLRDAPKMEQT